MSTSPIFSPAVERAELASRHYLLLTAPGKRALPFSAVPLQHIRRALSTGDAAHVDTAFKASQKACDAAGIR